MNAHPDAMKLSAASRSKERSGRKQCEQMLRIIDAQLADLEPIVEQLRRKRREWVDRLDEEITLANGPVVRRAPRGSVKSLIIKELKASEKGLDTLSLCGRISAMLPMMNPKSVRQALARLNDQGVVVAQGGRWKLGNEETN